MDLTDGVFCLFAAAPCLLFAIASFMPSRVRYNPPEPRHAGKHLEHEEEAILTCDYSVRTYRDIGYITLRVHDMNGEPAFMKTCRMKVSEAEKLSRSLSGQE